MVSKKNTAFTSDQFSLLFPEDIKFNFWHKTRIKIIYNEIKKAQIKALNFLEIGSGRGVVIQSLKKKGVKIKGVELANIEPYSEVKEDIIINTDAIDLESNITKKIDCILLLDVIEHIENPIDFLKEILNKYVNIKYILITVPARQELWSKFDIFVRHYRRYDLQGIKNLNKLGLKTVKIRYFFNSFYIIFRLILLLKKDVKFIKKAPKGIMKIIHNFISFCLLFEYFIMPSKLYGTSIIAILKKDKKINGK